MIFRSYDRYEVLLSFSLGVFGVFISMFIYWEAFERLFDPVKPSFSSSIRGWTGSRAIPAERAGVHGLPKVRHVPQCTRDARERRARRVWRSRATPGGQRGGHLAVIVPGWVARSSADGGEGTGWAWVDVLVAGLVIGVLLREEVAPVCREAGRLLLQTTPRALRDPLEKCLHEARTTEGVLEITQEHFWTHAPGVFVGSLHVRVRSDASEQLVLAKINNIFSPLIQNLTVQIYKDDSISAAQTRHAPGGADTATAAAAAPQQRQQKDTNDAEDR